ncbi:MAG: hypothetical protein ACREDZ_00980 [Kiloniellales bacterium]
MKYKLVIVALLILLAGALAFLAYDYWLLRLGEVSPLHLLELLGGVVLALALIGLLMMLYLFADRQHRSRH